MAANYRTGIQIPVRIQICLFSRSQRYQLLLISNVFSEVLLLLGPNDTLKKNHNVEKSWFRLKMQLVHISIRHILKPTAFKERDRTGMPMSCGFLLKMSSTWKYIADSGKCWDSYDLTFPKTFIGIYSVLTPADCETAQGPVYTSAMSIVWKTLSRMLMTNTCVVICSLPELKLPSWSCQNLDLFQFCGCHGARCFLPWSSCRLIPITQFLLPILREPVKEGTSGCPKTQHKDWEARLTALVSNACLPQFEYVI